MKPLLFRFKIASISLLVSGLLVVGFGVFFLTVIGRVGMARIDSEIKALGESPPVPTQDLKGAIFEKLAALRSITGTEGALKALATTEEILGRYYQELVPENTPESTHRLLKKHMSEVQVHKDYIDLNIKALSGAAP